MTSHLVPYAFAVMTVILVSVLGAVKRRERFGFVAGVVLVVAGPGLVAAASLSETLGATLSLLGVLAIVGSVVPLLRQSPATS